MDYQTYYTQEGSGNAVLFLHGWGGDGTSLKPVADRLLPRICALRLTFWGFGAAAGDLPPEGLCVADYAARTAALLERLAPKNLTIVAHSFGARVAIMLAATRPDLVSRLVLVGAAGLKLFSPKKSAKILHYKLIKLLVHVRILPKRRLERFGSADYRAASGALRASFVRVVRQDLSAYARKIACPVLLIYGSRDDQTPPRLARRLHRKIRSSGLVFIHNAGHFCFLERAGQFNAVLESFLQSEGVL